MASGTWLTCAILIENADACTRTYVRVSDTSTVRTVGFLLTVRYSEVLVGFPTNLHYVRLYWKVGIPTAFTTLLIFHPPSNIVSGTAGVYGLGEWNTRISKHNKVFEARQQKSKPSATPPFSALHDQEVSANTFSILAFSPSASSPHSSSLFESASVAFGVTSRAAGMRTGAQSSTSRKAMAALPQPGPT